MQIQPFDGVSFGADVTDVDLGGIGDADFKALHAAWLKHAVLRLRGQHLDDDILQSFSGRFGELEYAPFGRLPKSAVDKLPNPYIATISNIVKDGQPIGGLGNAEAAWHTDMSYIERPPTASLLYAVEVPASGGDTHFCNMTGALKALPPALEERVRGLRAKHDAAHDSIGKLRRGHRDVADPRDAPGASHRMVLRHPETGIDALYLGRRQDAYVEGLSLPESEALLDEVWSHVALPGDVWTQQWRERDLVIWDNRTVMHRRAAFSPTARRLMRRTQVRPRA